MKSSINLTQFIGCVCVTFLLSSIGCPKPIPSDPNLPVLASFDGSPTIIYEGDSVLFYSKVDNLYQDIDTFEWTFYGALSGGNDLIEYGPFDRFIIYNSIGKHDVSLRIIRKWGKGENSMTKEEFITVLPRATGEVKDIDNNTYDVVVIGGQTWLKQNLRTKRYNDGSPIPGNMSNLEWGKDDNGAYAVYDSNAVNEKTHGLLYNWFAVKTGKLCPPGWRIPTRSDFETLAKNVGNNANSLKTKANWQQPHNDATDSAGFSALGSGFRLLYGPYYGMGELTRIWSSTENTSDPGSAYHLYLDRSMSEVFTDEAFPKNNGFSCRCIKN